MDISASNRINLLLYYLQSKNQNKKNPPRAANFFATNARIFFR